MKRSQFFILAAAALAFGSAAQAQQPATRALTSTTQYDLSRESNLVGTVLSIDSTAKSAPNGVHVRLQTSSGTVDVHLGSSSYLSANHFTIQAGDTLRVIGEQLSVGSTTQFVARVIQKGTQALAIRTDRGFLIPYVAPRTSTPSANQRGVV